MAFAVRVTGLSESKDKLFEIEPTWWDIESLKSKIKFREELDYYLDLYATISKNEFIQLHKSFLKSATSGVYSDKSWKGIIKDDVNKMDESINDESIVQYEIWIYEWESGLG